MDPDDSIDGLTSTADLGDEVPEPIEGPWFKVPIVARYETSVLPRNYRRFGA